jgi:hypothetical protein
MFNACGGRTVMSAILMSEGCVATKRTRTGDVPRVAEALVERVRHVTQDLVGQALAIIYLGVRTRHLQDAGLELGSEVSREVRCDGTGHEVGNSNRIFLEFIAKRG